MSEPSDKPFDEKLEKLEPRGLSPDKRKQIGDALRAPVRRNLWMPLGIASAAAALVLIVGGVMLRPYLSDIWGTEKTRGDQKLYPDGGAYETAIRTDGPAATRAGAPFADYEDAAGDHANTYQGPPAVPRVAARTPGDLPARPRGETRALADGIDAAPRDADFDKLKDLAGEASAPGRRIQFHADRATAIREEAFKLKKLVDSDDFAALPAAARELVLQKLKEAEKAGTGGKGPTVWHRDAARPTMARVYVGDGNSLELVSLNVTVTVEGPRARTVVDHVFRNNHDRQLEGTFEYPLPTGASASYFAMFLGHIGSTLPPKFRGDNAPIELPQAVLASMTPQEIVKQVNTADWGKLQEARITGKEQALEAYEETTRRRVDPALLEYAGGNTFSGRVFPIPPKCYNRVILAYEELLPVNAGGVQYRFPLPTGKLSELRFALEGRAADMPDAATFPADVLKEEGAGQLLFSRTWKETGPGGEVRVSFKPPATGVQAISGRTDGANGPVHFYARIRPDLNVEQAAAFSDRAVFLLDTSLSEHPDRFAVSMKLLKKILETDPAIKQFNILTFDTAARWLDAKAWFANDAAGRDAALAKLDGILLEGATDFSAALDALAHSLAPSPKAPLNVFVLSDGNITWGDTDTASMVARFTRMSEHDCRFHCYRTGLGSENLELFEALTRTGGGVFQCHGEDDLDAAAAAHRSQCLTVENVRFVGGPAISDVLLAGRKAAVYPGGELVLAGKATEATPTTVVIEGTFLGKKYVFERPLDITGRGELAPRGWGELAVNALLALNDPAFDSLVTAYCQQFSLGSKLASFLVLENEAEYKRFNVSDERPKVVTGDLGTRLTELWAGLAAPVTRRQAFERFLAKADARVHLLNGPAGAHVKRLLGLLSDADFELPAAGAGIILYEKDVPPQYRRRLAENRRDADNYIGEAKRRTAGGDAEGAARCLSSLVEEMPGRSDALRLVGYRLMDFKLPAQAVRLFAQVQKNRPFEPHSYRDLARSLEQAGRFAWAAVQYEIVLAGTWHDRFNGAIKLVVQEEYVRMMRQAINSKTLGKALADRFGSRIEQLAAEAGEDDLRVTISWNTDATDVDLWVIEPDGTKCFYSHNKTVNGGELSADMTQGYGPERYHIRKAKPGVYKIVTHYYSANPNLLAGETHVDVAVARHAGTPREESQRYNVVLRNRGEEANVCEVRF